ncbi:hypothetical protein SAY86_027008 [Trapa natans]|uniref:Uncharacterized protein n=1 Tax=Trapa natans TaxID=22666 RepID=A0AAN7QK22_TRANT|nr:hypothetical protein SAY86_027008 [Trapa natans]
MESPPLTALQWDSRLRAPLLGKTDDTPPFSYLKFVQFAVDETNRFIYLDKSQLQDKFSNMQAFDGKANHDMLAYEAPPKIRLLRSLSIHGNDGMQVGAYQALMANIVSLQLSPWGGKLTSESVKFFSPMVIWTRFSTSPYLHDVLYSAFKDHLKAPSKI